MSTSNGATLKELNQPQTKRRQYNRLGYTKLEAAELVEVLNRLLANYSVHYQKLRNFHWNVTGGDFFDLHEKFEEQYNHAKVAIDDLAERIRVFGYTPLSTMREYLKHSDIKESGTDLTAMEMVREILKDYEMLLEYMFDTVEMAIDKGDTATEDIIRDCIQYTEKNHWMFTAFTQG